MDAGSGFPIRLTLTNQGSDPVVFDGEPRIIGTNAADFTGTFESLLPGIEAGKSKTVLITFDPSAVGARSASLEIVSNDADTTTTVALTGTGLTSIAYKRYNGIGPGMSRVGPGGEYASLSDIRADLGKALTGGDWTFQIMSDQTVPELFQMTTSTGDFGIYFRPAPGTHPVVDFTLLNSFANLYLTSFTSTSNLRNVIFDGASTEGGSDRSMTFRNALDPNTQGFIYVGSYTENIVFRNMIIQNRISRTEYNVYIYPVITYGATGGNQPPGGSEFPTNCVIDNCTVEGIYSAFSQGITTSGYGSITTGRALDGVNGLVVRNSEISSAGRGLYMINIKSIDFDSNVIRVSQASGLFSCYGVLYTPLTTPPSDDVSITIRNNRFEVLNAPTASSAVSLGGILMDGIGDRHTYTIVNNMISGVRLTGTGLVSRLHGIMISRAEDHDVRILHNSINIMPSETSYPSLDASTCFGIGVTNGGFVGKMTVRNNIVRNGQPGGGALYYQAGGTTYNSDYNNVYSVSGITGRRLSVNHSGLAAWRANTGFDMHSVEYDPAVPALANAGRWLNGYTQTGDFHFDKSPGDSYLAPVFGGIETDIDGEARESDSVYMGADHPKDDDGDGVASVVEDRAANGGDGNDDGLADRAQKTVSSIANLAGDATLTLVTSNGTFASVESLPIAVAPPPAGAFPEGLIHLNIEGLAPGGAATVQFTLSHSYSVDGFIAAGPTDDDAFVHAYLFDYDGTTGAMIADDSVTLELIDGGRGDNDLAANGSITFAGGPKANIAASYWLAY